MLQVYRSFLLVALPWLVLAVLEAWVFPLDKFTFRAWEAVQANLLTQALPGPFYPGLDRDFLEANDQDPARKKILRNRWITDPYGQRNRRLPRAGEEYGVIVGDSNVAGCSLDQSELLSEELGRQTGHLWVNLNYEYMAPWDHPLCRIHPPRWIIFELKRGSLMELCRLGGRTDDPGSAANYGRAGGLDRASKMMALNKIRSLISLHALVTSVQFQDPHCALPLSWVQKILAGGFVGRRTDPKTFLGKDPLEILHHHREACRSRGIEFIVLVLPDTVRQADPLVQKVLDRGIPTVGFLPTAQEPHGANLREFWQPQDSHWSFTGVRECCRRLLPLLGLD
ncbi:MAG: hypothetical protein EBZ05_06120 [Verrucomicrobia bacterium]|nr:hypothetical protein [Verrucomicrobiota bacterium]